MWIDGDGGGAALLKRLIKCRETKFHFGDLQISGEALVPNGRRMPKVILGVSVSTFNCYIISGLLKFAFTMNVQAGDYRKRFQITSSLH